MVFITDEKEIFDIYDDSVSEAKVWREDYDEFKRLANNDLDTANDDETLPETNDGSLSASLFKLPKRIVSSKLSGRAKTTDRDDAWITELANIVWEDKITKNANSQAPYIRKWKDAVRKAAIYGSVPVITLFVENGNYIGSDFIVADPEDVTLESGKISDYDSDIMFWDIYYSEQQVKTMVERAKRENKENKESDGYNKWDIQNLKDVLTHKEENKTETNSKGKPKKHGYKFTVAFQRGVEAPFYMFHSASKKVVREWSNPDPTGDLPIHYLYCYQDFENPYGIGIVKLAGGTQNVLDLMRKYDVFATALGFRPPITFSGDSTGLDEDSFVYAQDAHWMAGRSTVKREEISNQVYQQLPERIMMYKTSLNNILPMGDTTVSATAGDPQQSKTPAGVKQATANLSIDDEDFKDNLYITYEAVARSMINTHFANMQGKDIMKLSDEERDILTQAGLEFPIDEEGNPTNELEIIWDEARANFDFEMDVDQDKAKDDEKRLEGLLKIADFIKDPTTQQFIATGQSIVLGQKQLNPGELIAEILKLTTDNDKILQDITPEDEQAMAQEEMAQMSQNEDPQIAYLQAIMQRFGVDEGEAKAMLEAEANGATPEEILNVLQQRRGMQ